MIGWVLCNRFRPKDCGRGVREPGIFGRIALHEVRSNRMCRFSGRNDEIRSICPSLGTTISRACLELLSASLSGLWQTRLPATRAHFMINLEQTVQNTPLGHDGRSQRPKALVRAADSKLALGSLYYSKEREMSTQPSTFHTSIRMVVTHSLQILEEGQVRWGEVAKGV